MSKIRNEISKKNKYYISKHRYLELYHFCLQYPEWKKMYMDEVSIRGKVNSNFVETSLEWSDPTGNAALRRELYFNRMKLIEQTAVATDSELYQFIIKGVTEKRSFENLSLVYGMPCCRDTYYDRYRKFFWLLDQSQNKQLLV